MCTYRSWRSWWQPSVAATAYQARVPSGPAGKRCQSFVESATHWETNTSSRSRSRREPWSPPPPPHAPPRRCSAAERSACDGSRSATRSWCTWSARPTTVERTPSAAVSAHDIASVSEDRRPPVQTAATRCAVDVDLLPQRYFQTNTRYDRESVTLWRPLLPDGYSYKASCARPGLAVICNFWHLGTLTLSHERYSAQMSKITNDGLTRSVTGCFIAVPVWQQWTSKG